MKSNLIDITVVKHAETTKAVLVSDNGDKSRGVWVPLSQCEIEPEDGEKDIYVLTLPEWLAIDKGLI